MEGKVILETKTIMEKKIIFYIDDDEDIRTIVEFAFDDQHVLELVMCESGQDALEKIQTQRPDLILLDVMMPLMDGPTTLKHIRALPGMGNVPVAFVTAKVQPSEITHFMAMGAISVIVKPFDAMSLPDQVRALLPA